MDVDSAAPLPSPTDPVVDHGPTSPSPSQQPTATADTSTPVRLTKSGRPSKVKPIVPGSAADFRRRESNRLAAERSRFRQQDKVAGLENAAKNLNEENLRLRLQIAQLEGHSNPDDVHAVHIPLDHADTSVSVAGTPTAATSTPADHTQEQQEHSHTILAALTDITGVDFASEGSSWMQGMENFLKDSDASGRLGDLAAVATGHDEGAGGQSRTITNGAFTQTEPQESRHTGSNPPPDAIEAAAPSSPSTKKSVRPPALAPTASAVVVMAAAINTEMERLIMEDLAETKAAIVTLENQLNRLREGLDPGESHYAENVALLPTCIFSEDPDELHTTTSALQSRISQLEGELPGQREELVRLRDATTDEQDKLVAVVHELQRLAEEIGEEQKGKITEFLVEAGGFVKNLLDKQREQAEISSRDLPPGATFSPAIARRRRGRPPKSSLARSFYQSFLLAPAEVEKGEVPETKPKGKKRPRKSRLSKQTEGDAEEEEPSKATDATGAREEKAASSTPIVEASTVHSTEEGTDVAEAERIAALEAVDQAKAFLTSHMTSNTDPDHMDVGLDSTSFADLLPAQAGLASQDQVDEALASATREMNSQSQAIGVEMEGEGEEEQSVLSRLRRGPPGSCDICSRTETTVWRKLKFGQTELKVCNACGQYHSKFGVIRPFQLWGDGHQVRKRRSTQRLSSGGETDQFEGTSSSVEADAEGGPKKKQKGSKGKSVNPSPLTMDHPSMGMGMELEEGEDVDEEVEQVEVGVEDFMSPALQREVQHLHDQQQGLEVDSGVHDHDHDHGDVMARVLAGMGV